MSHPTLTRPAAGTVEVHVDEDARRILCVQTGVQPPLVTVPVLLECGLLDETDPLTWLVGDGEKVHGSGCHQVAAAAFSPLRTTGTVASFLAEDRLNRHHGCLCLSDPVDVDATYPLEKIGPQLVLTAEAWAALDWATTAKITLDNHQKDIRRWTPTGWLTSIRERRVLQPAGPAAEALAGLIGDYAARLAELDALVADHDKVQTKVAETRYRGLCYFHRLGEVHAEEHAEKTAKLLADHDFNVTLTELAGTTAAGLPGLLARVDDPLMWQVSGVYDGEIHSLAEAVHPTGDPDLALAQVRASALMGAEVYLNPDGMCVDAGYRLEVVVAAAQLTVDTGTPLSKTIEAFAALDQA